MDYRKVIDDQIEILEEASKELKVTPQKYHEALCKIALTIKELVN